VNSTHLRIIIRVLVAECAQRAERSPDERPLMTRERSVGCDDQRRNGITNRWLRPGDKEEVGCVLGHDGTPVRGGKLPDSQIVLADNVGVIEHRYGVVAGFSKPLSYHGRIHLIDQELQPSRRRRPDAVASASAAASSFRRMRSSISSGKAA